MFHIDGGQILAYQMNSKYGESNSRKLFLKVFLTFQITVIIQKKPPMEFVE